MVLWMSLGFFFWLKKKTHGYRKIFLYQKNISANINGNWILVLVLGGWKGAVGTEVNWTVHTRCKGITAAQEQLSNSTREIGPSASRHLDFWRVAEILRTAWNHSPFIVGSNFSKISCESKNTYLKSSCKPWLLICNFRE